MLLSTDSIFVATAKASEQKKVNKTITHTQTQKEIFGRLP